MKRTLAVLLLSAFIHAALGQTLYAVSAVNPSVTNIIEETTSFSAIGEGPSTTTTLISAPAIIGGKFEENASGFRFSVVGGKFAETCAFGADGRGTCVEREVLVTGTLETTFSGNVVPFYTLAVSAKDALSSLTTPPSPPTASGSSPSSTSTLPSPNSAAAKVLPIGIVVSCVVGTIFHAL
ncbi:hypothetical protein B0H19DRAFT_1264765 [Mycena capillaripes]|nr:hypothetical protein B0H19DRAFT_1264765 [Mycena capillaripes]